jgi:hypothetical protein
MRGWRPPRERQVLKMHRVVVTPARLVSFEEQHERPGLYSETVPAANRRPVAGVRWISPPRTPHLLSPVSDSYVWPTEKSRVIPLGDDPGSARSHHVGMFLEPSESALAYTSQRRLSVCAICFDPDLHAHVGIRFGSVCALTRS